MAKSTTIEVAVQWNDNVVIAQLIGEAGLQNADQIERAFLPIVASKPRLVVIDMSALDFIGSLGLGMLVELQRSLKQNGGIMRLAGVQDVIVDVIKRCRLEKVLKLHETVDEALHAEPDQPQS